VFIKIFVDLQTALAAATALTSKGYGLENLNMKHLIMLRV
jgi:hypothetical protein